MDTSPLSMIIKGKHIVFPCSCSKLTYLERLTIKDTSDNIIPHIENRNFILKRGKKMKSATKFISFLFLVFMLFPSFAGMSRGFQGEIKLPWEFGGFTSQNQLHLKYFYVFKDALDRAGSGEAAYDEAIQDNTGIVEVWFNSEGSLFRLDRYVEKPKVSCETFEDPKPETLSQNGKTYTLIQRIIQKGLQKTEYKLTSNSNKACRLEKNTSEVNIAQNHDQALGSMTHGETVQPDFWFYYSNSDMSKQMEASSYEMMKLIKRDKYDKVMAGWKEKQKIAGRDTVKNYNSAPVFGGGEGYELIDVALGIGLEGYLEGYRDFGSGGKFQFGGAKLVYKALVVETAVPDDVFEIN